MNSKLDQFFRNERTRIIEPDPFFAQRVMTRWAARAREVRESGIWEGVRSGAKPVFALAVVVFLAFLAIQWFIPEVPARGPIDAFMSTEQSDGEHLIYAGSEMSNPELERMLIITEDGQ
jgi:hypothetical protein